ncbi:MAG: hypothetical protein WB543_21090 [Candidatus Acidiferrum sp.]
MKSRQILMKLIFCYALFLLSSANCAAQSSWMLKGTDGKWKTFRNEAGWQKAAQEEGPLETAMITRTDKNIKIVYDVQGESGDWRNIDHYLFQANGVLIKLDRKFASVSQDIMLTEEYELAPSGSIKKKSEREVSLTTKKPVAQKPETPQLPIVTNMKKLDFMRTH